jgi:hypothetical protein
MEMEEIWIRGRYMKLNTTNTSRDHVPGCSFPTQQPFLIHKDSTARSMEESLEKQMLILDFSMQISSSSHKQQIVRLPFDLPYHPNAHPFRIQSRNRGKEIMSHLDILNTRLKKLQFIQSKYPRNSEIQFCVCQASFLCQLSVRARGVEEHLLHTKALPTSLAKINKVSL